MIRMTGWIIILMLAACTDRTKLPEGIIDQPKMEKVLWDMVQADRYVSSFIMNQAKDSPSVKIEKAALFYEKVFALNKITREQFLKSYKFYLGRPDITKMIFDSIASRADKQRDQMFRSSPKPSLLSRRDSLLRADSIRRADSIEKVDLAKPSTEELFSDTLLESK